MRATWTDSRLNDFAAHTDRRFDELHEDMRELRGELGSLHRTIIQFGGALLASFVGLVAAVLGLVATQL